MKRIKVVLIIMSLLAFASLGCQKSPTSPHFPNLSDVSGAEVVGSVVEARSNYPLPGATVYVIWKDSIVVRQTVTNENGKFYLNGLIPGLYDFIATAEGYLISKFSQVEIEPGENYICVGRLAKLDLIQQVERFYLLFKLGISLARQQQLIVESECRVREFKGSDLQGYYLFDTSEVDSLTEKITWFAWRPEVEAVGLCGDLKG
ncbi:MAG: carboxypeptidase-like regulatory domain-containing protein, partial [Candidatus Zixiibacteriota bacterium]